MGVTRKTISLPDDANELLQNLATDCGMDASQCITQLLRRHSGDIRNLFAIDVSKRMQSYAPVPTIVASVPPEVVVTKAEPIVTPVEMPSPEPTIAPMDESPADELARLKALKGGKKFQAMKRITELEQLLEA